MAFHDLHAHARTEDFPDPDELRGIMLPALIVHGDHDPFFPLEMPLELYRLLPNADSVCCQIPDMRLLKNTRAGSTTSPWIFVTSLHS